MLVCIKVNIVDENENYITSMLNEYDLPFFPTVDTEFDTSTTTDNSIVFYPAFTPCYDLSKRAVICVCRVEDSQMTPVPDQIALLTSIGFREQLKRKERSSC